MKLSNTPFCTVEIIQHALKGQKLLAQGNALGINDIHLTPCKGKSFTYRRGFSFFIRCILKLLPLQGALLITLYPGRCPGLGASALSGRAAYMGFLTFWACCCGLLGFQGVLLWAAWFFGAYCCGLLGFLGVAAYMCFLAFWTLLGNFNHTEGLAAVGLLGLRLYLKPANFKRIIQKKERK